MLKLVTINCPSLVHLLGHTLLVIVNNKKPNKQEDARIVAGELLQYVRTGVDTDLTIDDYSIELGLQVLKQADAELASLGINADIVDLYYIPMDYIGSLAVVLKYEIH